MKMPTSVIAAIVVQFFMLLVIILASAVAVAGPPTDRAIAVVNNAFGVTVAGPRLVQIADAFVDYRSDLVPVVITVDADGNETRTRSDPATLTNDQKAAILLEAVRDFIRGTTVEMSERAAEKAQQAAVDSARANARASAEVLFQ